MAEYNQSEMINLNDILRNGTAKIQGSLKEIEDIIAAMGNAVSVESAKMKDVEPTMGVFCNPTGGDLRKDPEGDGSFGSLRKDRLHLSKDYLCRPGQDVLACMSGRIHRVITIYEGTNFKGLVIKNPLFICFMRYLMPSVPAGIKVRAGEVVGTAQDVSKYYGSDAMKPHIDVQICVNPELLEGEA